MPDFKASEESVAGAFADADFWALVQGSTDVQGTNLQMWTYILAKLKTANVMFYQGVIDCSANPNYPGADAGDLYIVSVAGKIGGGSGIDVTAGDLLICKTDSTASGDHATVGAQWDIIPKTASLTGYALLAAANIFTANQRVTPVALTDGANIATNAALSNNFEVTLGGNRTFDNPTNAAAGMVCNWAIKQDATGGRTGTFASAFDFGAIGAPTLSVTSNAVDFVSAYYHSGTSKWLASFRQGA